MSLNPAQREGVEHRGSPLLVLAGAGTGKTRMITHRIASLLAEGIRPWEILAVTFTNKAAGEMRERIASLCAEDPRLAHVEVHSIWAGTFHSICARILRRYGDAVGLTPNYAIYDSADQQALMGRVLKEIGVSTKDHPPRQVLSLIDKARQKGWGPSRLPELGVEEPVLGRVRVAWERYTKKCRQGDAVDFGDLLVLAVHLLAQVEVEGGGVLADLDPIMRLRRRFRHVLVDEFQDTNPVQAKLVELLSPEAELCVVGDDDQAIYGWRGAEVDQILNFPQAHPDCHVIRLEQNYRSTSHILKCADAIIGKNYERLGKTLWSDLGEGHPAEVVFVPNQRDEARFVVERIVDSIDEGQSPEEIAVFYRTHAQSRALEEAVRGVGLHYRVVGGIRFFDRAEVKDLVAYLRLIGTPSSDVDMLRAINRPARGIGAKTIEKLAAHAAKLGGSLWDAAEDPEACGLGKRAAGKVAGFRALVEQMASGTEDLSLAELADEVLDQSGLRDAIAADPGVEAQTRLENLQEFLGALEEFSEENPGAGLAEYLERISLATSEDEGERAAAITLMTVHSAKGLEFDHVYLTGMEEKVFPHARAFDEPKGMEEERRLAYVAVTRARHRLVLTVTERRFLWGSDQHHPPSRFVEDLPASSIMQIGGRRPSASVGGGRLFFSNTERQKPQEERWDDDIELDPEFDDDPFDDEAEGLSLYVGMRVRHPKWGLADVEGWSGTGTKTKLRLRFRDGAVKTVLASFCQPL